MILISRIHFFLIISSSFLILACSISSSQLKSFTSTDNQPRLQNFYWDVTYDKLNYRLIAIDLPNGTLFSDKFGNSLFFDGWSIDSIVGFGDFDGEYNLIEEDIGLLRFDAENTYKLKPSCDEWTDTKLKDIIIYTQSCDNIKFINKIFVNQNDEITQIEQLIEPYNKVMTLKKSNQTQ